jgi:hypothetical protein
MARKPFLCLALIIGFVLSASPVLPFEKILFGPKEFTVERFHFHSSFQSFKAGKSGDAVLEISNANSHGKISSGYVNLNGRFFSLHPILHTKNSTMEVPVHLRDRNYLWVFLYGQRGAGIKLEVKEAKQEPSNHEPLALEQTVELDEDTTASMTLTGSDQDGDLLAFHIVSPPAHGTLSGDAPAMKYTASPDYNGSDTFTFIVNDGQADSKPATVNITVKPVNDPPKAVVISPASASVGEKVVLDGSPSLDVDGDKLTYLWTLTSTSYPAGVEPALTNGTEPLASFVPFLPGQYKAQLVVNDGATPSLSDTVTVTISVAYVPFSLTEQKLTAGNGGAGDRFGSSVSVDNHRAIIGAEGKEAAYIFESNSPWTQKTQLTSGRSGDRFGSAVAVSGDYALVGAYGDDDLGVDSGAAYTFRWDGAQWAQGAKLKVGDVKAGDFFGASVALSGDCAVVGASGDDTGGDVWVPIFGEDKYIPGTNVKWDSNIQGWVNSVNNRIFLYPADWARAFRPKAIRMIHTAPSAVNLFRVLSVKNQILCSASPYASGDKVLLPEPEVDDIGLIYALAPPAITNIEFLVPATGGAPDAGSAYVFKREGASWTQQAKLTASDGAEGDAFGISVAVAGQTVIVGADMDDDMGQDSGSAYVFVQDGSAWVEEAKLLAKDGQKGDQFGASVAISGNIAVVGAPGADLAGTDLGAAYVFRYNGGNWNEGDKLIAGDGKEGDLFGASVSISADYVVVGAPGADGSGALYIFKFDGSRWILEGKVNPADAAPGQDFGGSVSISGDAILSGAMGDDDQAGAAYAFTIDTYHTASISAEPEIIKKGDSSTLSWSWVNALVVQIESGIDTFAVDYDPIGSGSTTVSPDATTTYTITAYGPYGKDTASVTVFVE